MMLSDLGKKAKLWVDILWGILTLFAFVGVLLGKTMGTYSGIIIAIIWCLMTILVRMVSAIEQLTMKKKGGSQ